LRSNFRLRLPVAAVIVLGGLLALPAASQAAQVFGSVLLNQPDGDGCQGLAGACTVVGLVELPVGAQQTTAGSPIDGVITSFRVRAVVTQPTQARLRTATIVGPTATASRTAADGRVTLQAAGPDAPSQQFAVRTPVEKGEHLALEGTGLVDTHASTGNPLSFAFGNLNFAYATTSAQPAGELLVQATVEPDADHDEFGDETQDACPSQNTLGKPCDLVRPAIIGLKFRKGKILYKLSKAAAVELSLQKKVGRHFKQVGGFFRGGGSFGPNEVNLPAKPILTPGLYRLRAHATDEAGNQRTAIARFVVPGG
jgi:hypothetical protein